MQQERSGATVGWPTGLLAAYEARGEQLVRLATLMLGNRAEAEEVVHDAFVAVHRRWDGVIDVPAYLRRAVVNGANGVLRRRVVAGRVPVDPPPAEAPSQLVELRDVLLRLPARQRAAIALRFLEDLPDDEIARVLDCRPATVRSLIARGLAAVRKELS